VPAAGDQPGSGGFRGADDRGVSGAARVAQDCRIKVK
jgi:hypothetical protein